MVELLLTLPHCKSESIVTGQSFGASGEHDICIDDSRGIEGGCLVDSMSLPARGDFQREPVKEADHETRLPARQMANIGAGDLSIFTACCFGKSRATVENMPVDYNEPNEAIPTIEVEESRIGVSSSSGNYMGDEGSAAMNIAQLPVYSGEIECRRKCRQEIKMTTKCRQEDDVKDSFTDTSLGIASDFVAVSPEDWLDVASDFSLPLQETELDDSSFSSS